MGGKSKTRLRRRETTTVTVGMGWYRREDWERLLQMFPDRHTLQDTYDEWLADACGAERAIRGTGHTVKRVMVDPDELAAWCAIRGLQPVASTRAEYACDKGRDAAAPKTPVP